MNKHGLYSKAAQIIRGLQQERGTADQMVAAAKKVGIKDAELQNALPLPAGKVTRDELAKHFEDKVPKLYVNQYGDNPSYLGRGDTPRRMELSKRSDLSPEEGKELSVLQQKVTAQPNVIEDEEGEPAATQYSDYKMPGGESEKYRERLIELNNTPAGGRDYQSSHWSDHTNVLAHIRMQDRKAGDKRLLHVEEAQSDWGQEGRDKGFADPQKPYEVFNKKTKEVLSRHPSYSAAWDAYRAIPEDQAADIDTGKSVGPPPAPYVQNTQHWTDLALKNVLREAALGNYDGVVFTPGQAQADRYGLEQKLDRLQYMPNQKTLHGFKNGTSVVYKEGVEPKDLPSLIGKDATGKMLHPDNTFEPSAGNQFHELKGDDLKMGGEGMKGYYDNILPKSVMSLAKQHDPDIKPGEPVQMGDYQGFHLPMTDKLKQGILNDGFPAFKDGGGVIFAQGGATNEQGNPEAPTQAGELPVGGGVRGSTGLLQTPDETPLEGLPRNIKIPFSGEVIQAGPDPRIRAIARNYMSSTGMPYNPPVKYAKVDPDRAKRIAKAYDDMPHNPDDPLTKSSYEALSRETLAQYNAAKAAGFKAEFWNPEKEEDPYLASPRLAVEDVRKNNHMWVFPTLSGYGSGKAIDEKEARENPMLQLTGETWNGIPVTVNDVFRAIHDYYGHAKEGVGFRSDGEENAWRAHASMFSPLARLAMTTETRGQNSWLNFGPHGDKNQTARTEDTVFAPQKMGVLPHWAHHEGAEDFMTPEDIAEMQRHRARASRDMSAPLAITRRFTKRD